MAEITPRLMFANLVQLSNTVITPMSSSVTLPWTIGLRDQIPSNVGRSVTGWEVIAGYNDKLDLTEGSAGAQVFTLTPGTYETGNLLAAEIEFQLHEAIDNVYTVSYSATTNKFTIARSSGIDTFDLDWSTGSNAATSIGPDIGADMDHDDTGGTSYEMTYARLMSRFYMKFDLVSALEVTAVVLYKHNLSSTAVIRIQGNATDAWSSPSYNQLLTWNSGHIVYFTSGTQTYRYWRLYVDDPDNEDGFIEISVVYLGTYTQPSRSYQQRFEEPRQELSQITMADHGAHYYTDKPSREGFSGDFLRLSEADRTALESWLNYVKFGRNFFFALDPQNEPNDRTFYGSIAPTRFRHAGGGTVTRWNLPVTFAEALG